MLKTEEEENSEEENVEDENADMTMMQVQASYKVNQTEKPKQGQKSCVLSQHSKSLQESLEQMLGGEDSEDEEEDDEDHSIPAQLARWCEEVPDIVPGLASQIGGSNQSTRDSL